jgi:hypothetical protein
MRLDEQQNAIAVPWTGHKQAEQIYRHGGVLTF